ncbi:MAG: clan AA aspartic protease [Phycisphaerales bacterium]|nr:clan AA aspartic protease [Phycisphaerales bacterium]
MIVGSVNLNGEAIVGLRVGIPRSSAVTIDAIIDTGFDGWLTLSPSLIQSLALRFREEGRFTLADGSEASTKLFGAEIDWLGGWRPILVVSMDGEPLLGMASMHGCHLGIDVVKGGRVEIRPMTSHAR